MSGVRGGLGAGVGGWWRLGSEGRECWTVLWMDRVFKPLPSPTQWIVCHRLLRLYVEWEELAESSWIPESLRHVVWLAEQNPHSGEEQTWTPPTPRSPSQPPTPPTGIFLPARGRGSSKFVLTGYGCKSLQTAFGDFFTGAEGGLCLCTISFVFWPCEKNFCVSAFHSWYSLTLRC